MLIKDAEKIARATGNLTDKVKAEKEKRQLYNKRDEAFKEYEQAARDIDKRKENLIDDVEKRLEQEVCDEELFTIHWQVV